MNFFLASFGILFVSAGLSALFRDPKLKKVFGCGGVFAGALAGFIPAIQVLSTGASWEQSFFSPIPGLTLAVGCDPLSAFFLLVVFGLSLMISVYSWGYLAGEGRFVGSLPFFPMLVAAMAAVVCARDGFFFLVCWEVMSLASFFLVTTEHENREVRHAGWIYLVAAHLATAFLAAFFVLLSLKAGSFLFSDFERVGLMAPVFAGTLFVLAVIGFGTKAGIFPFHVWLPHAHPAAPSYISALMSGVMIKTGIYGILRALTFLPPPPLWWGETLVLFGVASAVLGVLYALMQHDLKRLLAYHSVENIGIIVVGIGLGVIGRAAGNQAIELLGFAGALFHVLNHALFKSLLFLGAGHVIHAAHTRYIDRLGGLLKKMPKTALTFLVASAAICGLPPFNGFVSEWLVYLGLFRGAQTFSHVPLFMAAAGIISIALAGGLAVACFTKVFGVIFLGEPRHESVASVSEAPLPMLLPMCVLAGLCLLLGVYPQAVWPFLVSASHTVAVRSFDAGLAFGGEFEFPGLFGKIGFVFAVLIAMTVFFLLVRFFLLRRKVCRKTVTWDCGYEFPSPRMQYTASSFAQPMSQFFRSVLNPAVHFKRAEGFFAQKGHFSGHVMDLAEQRLFAPAFDGADRLLSMIRKISRGRIQEYLAAIFLTLIIVLLWEVWIGI